MLLLALLALALWWWQREPARPAPRTDGPPAEPRAAPVLVEPVRFAVAQSRIEAVGTARARQSVLLYPPSTGEVREVLFRAGQQVRAGAPLLRLDSRREELAVAQAQVRLREAQELLQRYERTGDVGAVSESQIDQGRTAVEAARIALAQARVALADRTLRAPFSGHIGFTDLDPGDRVQLDTLVATLDDRGELLIDFTVPEAYLGALRAGQGLGATPWNGGPALQGRIDTVGTRVDAQQRSVAVRARVANPRAEVLPGSSFRVAMELPGRRLPVLPEAAIVWGGSGSALWQVRDGRAVRVPATIVQRREGEVLVDAALAEGDRVVVEGVQRLREGLPVAPQEAQPATAGAPEAGAAR